MSYLCFTDFLKIFFIVTNYDDDDDDNVDDDLSFEIFGGVKHPCMILKFNWTFC